MGLYGTLTIGSDGTYRFVVDNNHPAVEGLGPMDHLEESFEYTIADSGGLTDTAILTLTVKGTNDDAVIGGDLMGSIEASAPLLSATGDLDSTDVDNTSDEWQPRANAAATYGTYAITESGEWTYHLDGGSAAVMSLASGNSLTDNFTATTVDGTTREIAITITKSQEPCDINQDSVCDTQDIDAITQKVVEGTATLGDRSTLIEGAAPNGFNTYVGDSNLDGQFDEQDMVTVFIAGKYLTGKAATWAEGDWDGNGVFEPMDFVAAFIAGGYLLGPRAASQIAGSSNQPAASDAAFSYWSDDSQKPFELREGDTQPDWGATAELNKRRERDLVFGDYTAEQAANFEGSKLQDRPAHQEVIEAVLQNSNDKNFKVIR